MTKETAKIIVDYLISGGLFVFVIAMIGGYIRRRILNNQLKDILIEEIGANLRTLNENIKEVEEYVSKESDRVYYYGLDEKVFNSIVSSNKLTIFNKLEREKLFRLYRGVEAVNYSVKDIILPKPEDVSREDYLTKAVNKLYLYNLKMTKKHIKNFLYVVKKQELFEKLKTQKLERLTPEEGQE